MLQPVTQTEGPNTQSVYSTVLSAEPKWQYGWQCGLIEGDVFNVGMWRYMNTSGIGFFIKPVILYRIN